MRNTPFYAYGINFKDIVIAKAESEELRPSISKIHEYSGHKTLRVIFLDDTSEAERGARLAQLIRYEAYYDKGKRKSFRNRCRAGR